MTSSANATVSILTLGDGDFSYSLDVALWLTKKASKETSAPSYRLVATGIDTLEEVKAKYRNAPHLLKELQSLHSDSLSVSIHHGINAVLEPPSPNDTSWRAHHVIFNHPHLGTEDAALHSRFLSHFLHTAANHWMERDGGGVLHLTLVKEQYERWKCEEVARRHGLVLLERNDFVTPGGHYQHRRHQTGKSFASRAVGGSETFTFGRRNDEGTFVSRCLPWQKQTETTNEELFRCPHCEKSFREERSRKCHVKMVHGNKRKRQQVLQCSFCRDKNIVRTFAHEQALADHIRAKHSGLHSNIQPDWAQSKENETGDMTERRNEVTTTSSAATFGSCSICGLNYRTAEEETNHLKEFVPVASSTDADAGMEHQCLFCDKYFRDKRAKLQHENFCASRKSEKDAER